MNNIGYLQYWGKTAHDGNFHLAVYHCLDVAAVGTILLERDQNLLVRLATMSGLKPDHVMRLVQFFLALHDIGKFSDDFQNQRPGVPHTRGDEPCLQRIVQ